MSRRRGRHMVFMKPELDALLAALDQARTKTIFCGSAAGYGTQRWNKCHVLTGAIDDLAEELTGHREYFWSTGSGAAPPGWRYSGKKHEPDPDKKD